MPDVHEAEERKRTKREWCCAYLYMGRGSDGENEKSCVYVM